jgi:outer membrane protein insertion porin family/translocation and assembly module TamA
VQPGVARWLAIRAARAPVALLVFLLILGGCTKAPSQRFDLASLKVTGNEQLDDEEIEERIASRETPRFLGVFPGVIYDYQVFNRFVLERDLQRIERLYRSRGYYQAHVRAARVWRSGSKVKVEIVVEEGEPVLLRRVDIHGIEHLPGAIKSEALSAATESLTLDEPFDEEKLDVASKALLRSLRDQGYAQAIARSSADVNLPKRTASAGFWVEPGERAELGEITLQGLSDLPEDQVRRTLALQPGEPYAQSELDEAKRALLDLGVFSAVSIEPQLDRATPGTAGRVRIPILVRVEKAKLRSVRLGGGVHIDALKSDLHLTLGWEDQSFLGGMRKLQLEAVPGVVLYPTRFPSFEKPERLLPQGRVRSEFRQPGFVEARSNAIVKGQVNVYPVLATPDRDPLAPVLGYRDYRASVGVERTFRRLYGYLSHNLQINDPFAYVGELDAALGRVLISYPALFGFFDLRDNAIHPHRGLYLSNELEVAGVFGDAQDVKVQPELRVYLPLTRRTTLAARGSIGLLFARNYGDTVEPNALTGQPGLGADPAVDTDVRTRWVRDIQIMFLRGFFSGGPGSNRGYAPREIGPHGVVPFYNHGQSLQDPDVDCTPGSPSYQSAVCDLPLGGFTLWEAALELRYPLVDALSGTLFTDASDVSPRRLSFRFERLHLSVGVGLRYDTPVGPIRFDIGYRIPGLQAPEDAPDEGQPKEILGLPLAASFGIGESF